MTTTKTALITGGSQGLGKEMAIRLAEAGNNIIITYNSNKAEADKTVSALQSLGVKATAFQLNTAISSSFDAFLEQVSVWQLAETGSAHFDFLINNAGISGYASIADTTEALFDELLDVHVKGVFFLTQKSLPLLNNNGRIINISTGLARFTTAGVGAYAMMKGAIEVFTRYLAKEYGNRGITANTVAPGIIETRFTKTSFENENAVKAIKANTALGRTGTPKDIGGVVAFLCTEDAGWITGQRIEASGGMFL